MPTFDHTAGRLKWALGFLFGVFAMSMSTSHAQESQTSSILETWQDAYQQVTAVDASVTGLHTRRSQDWGGAYTFGLDHYARLSNETKDLATINLQLYLTRFEDHPMPPGFADGPTDWEFTPRINTINWHVSGDGRFNIKVGHYEMPYGIEHTINSNGTLRQFTTGPNLGTKVDWGITLNGTLPKFLYEVGVGRGSGMDFKSDGNPHLLVGRIGSPVNTQNFWGTGQTAYGLSFFQGDLLRPNGTHQQRWRIGLDGQHYLGPVGLLGEVSVGQTEGRDQVNGLVEVNLTNPSESLLLYSQYRWQYQDLPSGWADGSSLAIGVRYAPSYRWALSTQFSQPLRDMVPAPDNYVFALQARFRY